MDAEARAEDARLVSAAAEGDTAAFEQLVRRHIDAVYGHGLRFFGEPQAAEDVAQEILLAVHRSMAQFRGDGESAFRSWLFTIAENRVRDLANEVNALKRQTPEPRAKSQLSPSGHAMHAEASELLRDALARLSPGHQEVIRLRRFQELETTEIAAAMGRSPTAIRVLYCRAIRALRAEMDANV